jgi:hypothetical protein
VAAVVTVGLALILGAPWWTAFTTILYAGAIWSPWRVALATLAPLPVIALTPVASLLGLEAVLLIVLALTAWVPLLDALGGRIPLTAPVLPLLALGAVVAVLLMPFAFPFAASDIATGAQIALLGAATLLAVALLGLYE